MLTILEHGEIYSQARIGPQQWLTTATGDTLHTQVCGRDLLIDTRVQVGDDHLDLAPKAVEQKRSGTGARESKECRLRLDNGQIPQYATKRNQIPYSRMCLHVGKQGW